MIGIYPERFDTVGTTRLFINAEPFPYSGKVVSVSYYLHEATDTALLVGIWQHVGNNTFKLLNKVQLPTSNQGFNNHVFNNPMLFQAGECFGFHTAAAPARTGLSLCTPTSQWPACNCGYSSPYYKAKIRDQHLPIDVTVTLSKIAHRAVAIMANIEP